MKHFNYTGLYRWRKGAGSILVLLILLPVLGMALLVAYKETILHRLVPIPVTLPAEAMHASLIGSFSQTTPMQVRLTFKLNQSALTHLEEGYGQRSNSSGVGELAALGVDKATYQATIAFFQQAGIEVKPSPLRTYLALNARTSAFENVFHVPIVLYRLHMRTFYAPVHPPLLPQFIASTLLTITGLDNYSAAPEPAGLQLHFQTQHTRAKQAADCVPLANTLRPKQVAHAYGYDQLWNQGQHGENMTINLLEVGAFNQSDIQNYFSCIGFAGNLRTVTVNVGPNPSLASPKRAALEATLDIEMAAGLARSANIVDYQPAGGGDDSFVAVNDMLQQIIADHMNTPSVGDVVSISLGISEDAISPADRTAVDQSLVTLTQGEHLGVFVASGDNGAFTDTKSSTPNVSFPASDPSVVAVGGTVLSVDSTGTRLTETAWPQSGRGTSTFFARPSWQQASGLPPVTSNGNRQLPDVSAVADKLALYAVGQWGGVGGTSAAAPIWAAGIALVNEALRQQGVSSNTISYPQELYVVAQQAQNTQTGSPYFTIATGSITPGTTLQQSGVNWDPTTGLGSPNLAMFQAGFANGKPPA